MRKHLNWIIVVATIALVVVPLVHGQFRAEMARWYLAAASNAIELGQGTPDQFVDRATAIYSDSEKLRDYWLFQLKRAMAEKPDSTAEQLRGAVAVDPAFVDLCDQALPQLWLKEEFQQHIEVLEIKREIRKRLTADELNELAYSRSLVGLDLDQALEDIDQAIKSAPSNWAYRDTRAWVLFQMGRPLEALDDIQFAIRELEQTGVVSLWLGNFEPEPEPELELPQEYADALDEQSSYNLSRSEAGDMLWGTGALYYHRARILESLGRDEEAEKDWEWLRKRKLPTNGSLY